MSEHNLIYAAAGIAVLLLAYIFIRRGWLGAAPAEGSRFAELGEKVRLRDLFRLAVMVEEKGRDYYLKMAGKSVRPETKALCAGLAEDEALHREQLLEKLGKWRPLEVNPLTWPVFVEKAKEQGFFDSDPGEDASEDQMAEFAIRQEVKSAEFYQLFEAAFPIAWERARLHKIVTDERTHEAKLRAAYPHIR